MSLNSHFFKKPVCAKLVIKQKRETSKNLTIYMRSKPGTCLELDSGKSNNFLKNILGENVGSYYSLVILISLKCSHNRIIWILWTVVCFLKYLIVRELRDSYLYFNEEEKGDRSMHVRTIQIWYLGMELKDQLALRLQNFQLSSSKIDKW